MRGILGLAAVFLWAGLMASEAGALCNSTGYSCSINSDCPLAGTVYTGLWYYPDGAGFCDPSSCHWHQPTHGCTYNQVWSGVCSLGNCNNSMTITATCGVPGSGGDCINTVALCTTGACTSYGSWSNTGCAAHGCAVGTMSQQRTGISPSCCGPSPDTQCLPDPTCSAPVILSFTASAATIYQGDPVTLTWTLGGGTPSSESLAPGIGPVAGLSYVDTPAAVGPLTYTLTVSNPIGTVTATTSITVLPPLPHCGAGKICGYIHATEKPSLALPNRPVELRDFQGNRMRCVYTDTAGFYQFTGLPVAVYWLYAPSDRDEVSNPNVKNTQPNNVIGADDFMTLGVPAKLVVTGTFDSFVLVSTFSYLGAAPPSWGPGLTTPYPLVNSIVLQNMTPPRPLFLRGNESYWFRCWVPKMVGQAQWVYVPGASQPVAGGVTLWPLDNITEVCP